MSRVVWLETGLVVAAIAVFFLSLTLLYLFRYLHRDFAQPKVPDGHAGPHDALVLAQLPLTLGRDRLYISPGRGTRIVRYGLADDGLVAEGPTMADAVAGMRCIPEFRRRWEQDQRIAARYEEYD